MRYDSKNNRQSADEVDHADIPAMLVEEEPILGFDNDPDEPYAKGNADTKGQAVVGQKPVSDEQKYTQIDGDKEEDKPCEGAFLSKPHRKGSFPGGGICSHVRKTLVVQYGGY